MTQRLLILFTLLLLCKYGQCQQADSIVLNDAVLYYYTYGNGEPIILLSGGPGSASHQIDNVAMELGKKYKTVLFDQRGTGKSWTKPFDTTTINIDQAIEDLDLLREHLHIDKLNLYGRSWGSMLASAYIAKYPDRVRLFVSVNGGELDNALTKTIEDNEDAKHQKSDTIKYKYWTDSTIIKQDEAKAKHELRKLYLSYKIYDTTKLETAILQLDHGKANPKMTELMLQTLKKRLHFIDGDKKFKGYTLVIFGWNDMIGLTTVTQYLRAFPMAEVKGIYKCGHFPEIEQPEKLYAIVNPFLQQHLNHK